MIKAISHRFLQMFLSLFILVSLTFFALRLLPGGPFDAEISLPPEAKAQIEAHYHLSEPTWKQYVFYLGNLAKGDLGTSYKYLGEDISEMIKESLGPTFTLGLLSLLLSYAIGLPLGLMAAQGSSRLLEGFIQFISAVGLCLPSFFLAPVLILIFSFWLDLLPPALWEGPSYWVLPIITLSLRPMAMIIRLVRASALDLVHADFIRAARAKGVSEKSLTYKHILRNSLLPLLGISGSLVANILSGSFIVELIYAIPGVSHHFIESALDRDYPLILGLTLLYGFILSMANLLMDILTSVIDPRVRAP